MNKIAGIFDTKDRALKAVKRLKESGFQDHEISVLLKEGEWIDPLKKEIPGGVIEELPMGDRGEEDTSTEEFFLGMGAIAAPLGGPVLAAGPIANAMNQYAKGRSLDLREVLEQYEVDEDYTELYLERLEKGHVMVLVDEDEVRKEKAVLSFYEEEDYEKDGIRRGDPGLDLHEKEVDPEDPLKDPRRLL
ncbi:hypothetical protein [Proteiniclasticum ruminis]|uniref:Heat induced stress protein YflT n=1 Tax=Proteiniclasticum ruminis TaxID=398199 RepID=A0A1I5CSK0_9CLOT|nr:hypothetical protein [Proteiniclasticum ruminis]SFN89959.1 hypothetical protein SAMN04488695_10731 [Proteiniclasticum ruminis]